MLREPFITGQVYHIFNRGVEKRDIFMDDADRRRFLLCLMACNTDKPIINLSKKIADGDLDIPPREEQLVHILTYCFMPNHYHLLLVQAADDGIKRFMHKVGTAYTMYFNTYYQRVGPLFQGVFKSVEVTKQEQLGYIPHYIHANPLDLDDQFKEWRVGRISNVAKAVKYLESYQWSSFRNYVDLANDNIVDGLSIKELFGDKITVAKDMKDWLKDMIANNAKVDTSIALE